MVNTIERVECVVSGEKDFDELYTFRQFPIYMGVTDQNHALDEFVDMAFVIAHKSGMIQLKQLIPSEQLYDISHNSSEGGVWHRHHMEFAEFINKFNPKGVLEVGGGNGRLSKYYRGVYGALSWTIIEPSSVEPLPGVDARYIREFFSEDVEIPERIVYDTIVHSHLLEHMYMPKDFLKQCACKLNDGQVMIFTLPNLHEQLHRKYTNALNFEHTFFLTEPYLYWLLSNNQFEVIDKKYFMQDHSIFFACKKNSKVKKMELPDDLYDDNKSIFEEYVGYYKDLVLSINEKINETNGNVYLFGAHIFSQYLIAFGLNVDNICAILDNDKMKQGKRLYGTELQVRSPKVLAAEKNPAVILKCGSYNDEIKEDILRNINKDTIFWE